MAIARGFAATAIFASIAVIAGSTAWADPPTMSGHYVRTITNAAGQNTTLDWYVTPCGDGCIQINSGLGTTNAQLVNGQWTMDNVTDAICPDDTSVPAAYSNHFTWDPNTLAGTVQVTNKIAACGDAAGTSGTQTLQITKAR